MSSSASLHHRSVIITGAGKGLGRAFAHDLAQRGCRVVVNNRAHEGVPSAAESVASEIHSAGGDAVADHSDMQDAGVGEALVNTALAHYGAIDGLILNAGITGPAAKVADSSFVDLRSVFETNFFSAVSIVMAALPSLRKSTDARVVFVASTAGLYGVRGRAPYAASKAAMVAYALTLAAELKREGVGVNILVPYAETQMTAGLGDSGLDLSPALVAPVTSWLMSPECHASGEIWVSGGGYVRRARMEEGLGAALPTDGCDPVAWLAANAHQAGDMQAGRGFPGAEAAFTDLMTRLQAARGGAA
ncbi:SDR family NAD(P)-dependent oxidoreductase [Kordiimonas sp.]|uniref:SDR family NAD(P)-dependent oxidoreductase n=1 Tax=Kordiimonas sp. TaxID=1970157 RepID=UPI003A913382